MPRLTVRLPDDIPDFLVNKLLDDLENQIALELSVEGMILSTKQLGTFLTRYDKLSRPCEPISVTVTALDRPGRAERLQTIANRVLASNGWIKELPKRHKEWIDLDFDRRAEEDWVAA